MQDLILLHGAAGSKAQLESLADQLKTTYRVHLLNFPGHGDRAIPSQAYSIELFADAILHYIEEQKISTASLFGYSMGGYVAMYLARHFPGKLEKIITLATKFHWDTETALKEQKMLDPELMLEKVPAFAKKLEKLHEGSDWKKVLLKTKELLLQLGEDNALKPGDYRLIKTPSLLLLGDRDKMVGLDETLAVYKNLATAQFGILPGTPHPVEQVDMELLGYHIRRFLG